MASGVGLKEVARRAGVSPMTASRVFRGEAFVRPEVVASVHAAADELGYVPNSVAGSLKSRRSQLIAIIVPTIHGSVFSEAIGAVSQALEGTDFQLIVGESSYDLEREEAALRKLIRRRPDGLILVGTNHTPRTRAILATSGIPVVEIWDESSQPVHALVGFSNRRAAEAIGEGLIAKGYREFGLLTGPVGQGNRAQSRIEGFRAVLARAGLREVWSLEVDYDLLLGRLETGGRTLLEHLRRLAPVRCLFCTNELTPISLIVALRRAGERIPEDVAVAGFGDVEMAALVEPPLTTVRIRGAEMGRRAVGLLLDHLVNGTSIQDRNEDVGYEVAWRDSA